MSLLAVSCGNASDDASTADADATSSSEPEYAPELWRACELAAREAGSVPIAAFEDPANDALVVCWADANIPKSPPPDADGTRHPSYNRVVFTATMEGEYVEMVRAGYRDQMDVTGP